MIDLLRDDTLFHHRGEKIEGAGVFRDAVRSSANSVAPDRGLSLDVLALRLKASRDGKPLALPLTVHLHRKGGTALPELGARAVRRLAERHPDRKFRLIAEGTFAPLAGEELPRTEVTSRIRQDAPLYGFREPRPPGTNCRPTKKGERLPPHTEWATRTRKGWETVVVDRRGRLDPRLQLSRVVLWYGICGNRPIRVVVSRDPSGRKKDDFLFTTDLAMSPGAIVNHYFRRWPI